MTDTQSENWVAQAQDDGFVLIDGLISPEDCDVIGERLLDYACQRRAPATGMSIQREPDLTAADITAPGQDVRKISGLHADDLIREKLISRKSATEPLRQILGDELRLFRADALMKPAHVGSAKGYHQDSPYWPIRPMSLWSCWSPLDDTDEANGCMLVIPRSHHGGALPHGRRDGDFVIDSQRVDGASAVAVPMRRGSGLLFHSLLVHATEANKSDRSRRAITMSYMGQAHTDSRGTSRAYPTIG